MWGKSIPAVFEKLLSDGCVEASHIVRTADGFFAIDKSLSDLLRERDILDFPDFGGERLACDRFFDDWFLYAVSGGTEATYGLFKLREQEHDAVENTPADGDTPGVTISFISFRAETLLDCLAHSEEENRKKLAAEINRVVARKGQRHHCALKRYFKNPASQAAYLVAAMYVKKIWSYAQGGCLPVPECYKSTVQRSISYKKSVKFSRLPQFIESLNQKAGRVVCDHSHLYFENRESPTEWEAEAILATHTGNTSVYSFAAEVEYHAKFLTPLAKIKIPFFAKSIYDSAVRADMTVGDTELEGPAPFHLNQSGIVKRQRRLHEGKPWLDDGIRCFEESA